jgi:hypothetical protein
MVRAAFAFLMLLACVTSPVAGQDAKPAGNALGNHPGLEQFKQLAGEWVGKERIKEGHDLHVTYKVTAGGSAVVETLFPGTEHEMISVIHPDGDDLVLTHYCMLGNQPQMRSTGNGEGNQIAFKFARATNLKSEKDMHMHDVTFTFVNKDTLRAEWTHYKDGKAAGQVTFEVKRKR